MNYKKRQRKLLNHITRNKLDAILISCPTNVRYLTGFADQDSALLVSTEEVSFLTDARFKIEANEIEISQAYFRKGSLTDLISKLVKKFKYKKIGFEANKLTYHAFKLLAEKIKPAELAPTIFMVESLRAIKDKEEIACIRKALEITHNTLDCLADMACPGMSEDELARAADLEMKRLGAEEASFNTIALAGQNTVRPHGRPGREIIKPNDMVLLDLGARYQGYNSDLTKMLFLGKISSKKSAILDVLKKAQHAAITKVKPGVIASFVDRSSRKIIEKSGLGRFFSHALGHGVGLEIHESPWISETSNTVLKPGMVFTIEPAVYLPGWGGLRLEDMVLVTKQGCEVLSNND